MATFYTRNGDDGYTGLLGEGRVPKYHPRTEAIGALDEASAALGLARALCQVAANQNLLLAVQRDLYQIMAETAATPETAARFRTIDQERVVWLEGQIDLLGTATRMPAEFIVPGDSLAGAALALARATVRRAERQIAQLTHQEEITNLELLRYLNRLSSLCFLLELAENSTAGTNSPTLAKESK